MIVHGGPPAGALHVRQRLVVRTPLPDDYLTRTRGLPRSQAVPAWWHHRRGHRIVWVFMLADRRWYVLVTNGLGEPILQPTPAGLDTLDSARRVARAACDLLRPQQVTA